MTSPSTRTILEIPVPIADTDHRSANTKQGIWRSSNRGQSRQHVGIPPCDLAYPGYGEGTQTGAHVQFAPTVGGHVIATTPCGVGESVNDGLTWHWDIIGSAPFASGAAAIKVHRRRQGADGLLRRRAPRQPLGGDEADVAVGRTAAPRPGTRCQLAARPRAVAASRLSRRIVRPSTSACGTTAKRTSTRAPLSGGSVAWTDLKGPTYGAANGRPIVVATHADGTGFRLYYSNTTLFTWEQCTATCPHPASAYTLNCPIDARWSCMAYFHSDFAAITFDPSMPNTACPLFAASDGGVVGETACGSDLNSDGLPLDVGLHALQVFAASLTRDRDVVLATQDNSALQRRSGAWRSDFCGDSTDTDALGQAQYVQTCDASHNVVSAAAITEPHWPWDAHPIFDTLPSGLAAGLPMRFSSDITLAAPTIQTSTLTARHTLSIAVSRALGAHGWGRLIPAINVPDDGTACCGAFAIGGRAQPAGVERRFYVSLASSSSSLARRLYCLEGTTWSRATGVPDPVAVWSAPGPSTTRWSGMRAPSRCTRKPLDAPATLRSTARRVTSSRATGRGPTRPIRARDGGSYRASGSIPTGPDWRTSRPGTTACW